MDLTRRRLVGAVGAGVAGGLAGCLDGVVDGVVGGEEPTREAEAEAALERTRTALEAVTTYRYRMTLDIVEGEGDAGDVGRGDPRARLSGSMEGAVDLEAGELSMAATVDDTTREAYLVDGTVYQECARMGWGTRSVDDEGVPGVRERSPAHRHLSLLDEGDLRIAGGGTVGDREATILEGVPSPGTIAGETDGEVRGPGGLLPLGAPSIEDVSVRVWIDDGTDLPLRTDLSFRVSARDGTASARMRSRYRDYGEPVAIEVPDEAIEGHWELGCPEWD